jgi:hypothetical protein
VGRKDCPPYRATWLKDKNADKAYSDKLSLKPEFMRYKSIGDYQWDYPN